MAKDQKLTDLHNGYTVGEGGSFQTQPKAPAGDMQQLQAQVAAMQAVIDQFLNAERMRQEASVRKAVILDPDWEAEKARIARPASVRTQEAADAQYGTAGRRFRVRLEVKSGEPGRNAPSCAEHFPLEISANSDLEAQARYQQVMGIRGFRQGDFEYKLVAEAISA